MRIESLEAFGITPDILAIWRDHIGPMLLRVQGRAIGEGGLFQGHNLVVFAPTSSGKTAVGEMAAVCTARMHRKVFYLVPQKALAEEKFEELRRRYASTDLRIVISTRDRREYDVAIERGEFHIAVVVFEKLEALLVGRPPLLSSVGLVVVDELQLITDETRGPRLELLLTKIRSAPAPAPRLIGLSAVLGRAQALADWLGARLLVDAHRPVELRKGVLCKGVFAYREHNTGGMGTETFALCEASDRRELVFAAAAELQQRGEQVLVFLPDRGSTVDAARAYGRRGAAATAAAATAAIAELAEHEETLARETLRETLAGGVAFHNADLSREERELVERHFRGGAIRVLFSTSTLAMGLNLPARNVVIEPKKWRCFRPGGRWGLTDITKSEYENMSGRAGRLAFGAEFGRSILVTNSRFEADVWMDHFVGRDFEEIVPTLKEAPLEDHVADLLAAGAAASRAELEALLRSSFTGYVEWNRTMSREAFAAMLGRAVEACVAAGLAEETGERLVATRLGRAAASKGLRVEAARAMARWASAAKSRWVSELEVLAVLGKMPGALDVHVPFQREEFQRNDYRRQVLMRAAEARCDEREVFVALREARFAPDYEEARALKKTLLLFDWIAEVRARDLERAYQVWAGAIARVGEEFSWLVDALVGVAAAFDWPEAERRKLEVLSARLVHGVRADAVGLTPVRVRGLGRVQMRRLVAAGFSTVEALRKATEEQLGKVLGNRRVAGALWERLQADGVTSRRPPVPEMTSVIAPMVVERDPVEPVESEDELWRGEEARPRELARAQPDVESQAAAAADGAPVLHVDVVAHRVYYRGIEIPTRPPHNLQPQLFRALAVLAQRAGRPVTMAEMAEGMYRLGGLRRKPITPEARDLRYRILRQLGKTLEGRVDDAEIEGLIENLASIGLRLVVPGRVEVTLPEPDPSTRR